MSAQDSTPAIPGACYKFTVSSAEEAAALIRERLGPDARVLSVRNVEQGGVLGLLKKPKLEVIAQLGAPVVSAAEGLEEDEEDEATGNVEAFSAGVSAPGYSGAASPRAAAGRIQLPAEMDLTTLLRRSGLSELALGRLKGSQIWPSVERAPLHRGLVDIGNYIRETASAKWGGAPLRRAAFLGTAGSGRTTALCKWLGLEVFRRARAGHVVTVEFDRPNPTGALPVYCEALGVPLARFPASTEPAVPNGFVYLDLPGLSVSDPRANRPLADFLDSENITERVLVLNAAYDHACIRAAYTAARDLGATHVVFTHLDEMPQWGRLWDYLLDGALEPLFLGTGPTLTGDCEDDVFGALVRRTLAPVSNEIPFARGVADPAGPAARRATPIRRA